jgi:hypothetical protein
VNLPANGPRRATPECTPLRPEAANLRTAILSQLGNVLIGNSAAAGQSESVPTAQMHDTAFLDTPECVCVAFANLAIPVQRHAFCFGVDSEQSATSGPINQDAGGFTVNTIARLALTDERRRT